MNASLLPLVATMPAVGILGYTRLRQGTRHSALRSLARPHDVAALTPKQVAQSARRLRELPRKPDPSECGVLLGRLQPSGTELRATWEDTTLSIMAPRAGKTTALATNAVLDAPGPVLATSNKADLWATTNELRMSSDGARDVWTFDPQHIAYAPQDFWWNPLASATTVEGAQRLASMFIHTVDGENSDKFWPASAHRLLVALFIAAQQSQHDIDDVWRWLTNDTDPDPGDILRQHGPRKIAESFEGIQGWHEKTRSGVYATAQSACQCLADENITRWVTPNKALRQFHAANFVESHDTLFLLSKDGGGSAAPLVAALADSVFRAAIRAAECAGGRLDPPLIAVLDEAANVCRISDLPLLYSHLGSRSIIPITILQSYAQGAQAWGHAGMKTLWGASTIKLVGAGEDDASFTNDISQLIGEHDIPTISRSNGRSGHGRSHSTRRDRIMGSGDIRALPKLTALLFATGCKPALIKLVPWYNTERKQAIHETYQRAVDGIAERSTQ